MSNIFYGYIFVFLDFNITYSNGSLSLLPDFVGWYLIFRGLTELLPKSVYFNNVRKMSIVMIVITAVAYFCNAFGLLAGSQVIALLFTFTTILLSLFITYSIIKGIIDIEQTSNFDLNSASLMSCFRVIAVCELLIPIAILFPALAFFAALVVIAGAIVFLFALGKSRKLYLAQSARLDF